MTRNATPATALRARIRRARQKHPGWHIWASDAGRIYATKGSMTAHAATTAQIGDAIRQLQADLALAAKMSRRSAA